ncbi:MAG: RluA family pseudouridine synthase [Candidatus Shikimatogenerans sp. JK-2022]|nr:RluA family pseudouridine synthase [Candidatus Shikimatogenerans bostrichidophilus]
MIYKKIIYIKKFKIKDKIRIDKFLYFFFKKKNISRKKIQNNIKLGNVLVNKLKIKKKKKINNNDIIYFFYKKNFFKKKKNKIFKNKNIKIKIIYEDKNLILINKQSGLIVQPGYGNYKNTLINWLKFYNNNLNINYRYGLLHRIDKYTTGLLIIAKNIYSFNYIKKQFIKKKIIKKYIVLVWGKLKKNKFILYDYISKNFKKQIKMKITKNKKYGKLAITKIKIIKKFKYFTLIKCNIITGRTHQIRVQLYNLGYPVFNDILYKKKIIINNIYIKKCFSLLKRQALHSYFLKFKHPTYKKKIKFIIKIPKDFKKIINFIKKKKL